MTHLTDCPSIKGRSIWPQYVDFTEKMQSFYHLIFHTGNGGNGTSSSGGGHLSRKDGNNNNPKKSRKSTGGKKYNNTVFIGVKNQVCSIIPDVQSTIGTIGTLKNPLTLDLKPLRHAIRYVLHQIMVGPINVV